MTRDKKSPADEPSTERPKVEKETVKDLDPKTKGDDVKGGQVTTTADRTGCDS